MALDTTRKITIEKEAARSLLANIRDVIGDDDDALRDAVEGETNLIEALALADERLIEIAALLDGIEVAIKTLKTRADRLESQSERFRAAMMNAMSDLGLKKVELPTATLSLAKSPDSVRIVSEADLPSQYMVEKVEIRPDKKALLDQLKSGASIPGAELANGAPRLTIRRA